MVSVCDYGNDGCADIFVAGLREKALPTAESIAHHSFKPKERGTPVPRLVMNHFLRPPSGREKELKVKF